MRLINADALIKELNSEDNQRILKGLACCNNGDMEEGFMRGLGAVEKLINDQPTADDWIPCSERLPKNDDDVLVSTEYDNVAVNYYQPIFDKWNDEDYEEVLAWKPKPESYKGV